MMSVDLPLSFLEFGLSYLIAVMSPGPSMIIILRNSLFYSSKIGFFTALGTVIGIALQALYTILGVSFLHHNHTYLSVLSAICSIYLFFFGVKIFFSFKYKNCSKKSDIDLKHKGKLSAFKEGFFIDALNPLALTFFLASFSLLFSKGIDFSCKIGYWSEIVIIGAVWFMGLPLIFKNETIKNFIVDKLHKPLNFLSAILFIVFAVKLGASNFLFLELFK